MSVARTIGDVRLCHAHRFFYPHDSMAHRVVAHIRLETPRAAKSTGVGC